MKTSLFCLLVLIFLVNAEEFRLIKTSQEKTISIATTELEKLTNQEKEYHYMDVTDTPNLEQGSVPQVPAIIQTLRKQDLVHKIVQKVEERNLNATITHLSNYFTRFHTTDTAVQAAHWLRDQYQGYINKISDPERRKRFSVSLFTHTWKQPSIIVKFKGTSASISDEVVVLGGHIDSTAGGATRRSPGADDDATGSSTVLEAFRLITEENSFNPERSVEFHGYSAEEVGLLGSQAIVQKYKADGVKVFAMLQSDMTGWNPASNQDKVGIITDFTSAELNVVLRKIITEYAKLPQGDTKCGYACSDHGSFTRAGYRSAFHFEVANFNSINRNIHTVNDILAHLDMKRAAGFVKICVGFVAELAYE